jgi:epoxyqueuosine reductase
MRLLLHICCGPCAVYPAQVLKNTGLFFEGLFFNPNIHPYDEFLLRKENVAKFSISNRVNINYSNEFNQQHWKNFSGSPDKRCEMCYSIRIEATCKFCVENGFDSFTTSLLVSPYQKHDLIAQICLNFSQKYNIGFYYYDFRPGFREGQNQAKSMGLYRQKYCGCINSLAEATQKNTRPK